jgi:hypothetical protein
VIALGKNNTNHLRQPPKVIEARKVMAHQAHHPIDRSLPQTKAPHREPGIRLPHERCEVFGSLNVVGGNEVRNIPGIAID